MNAIPFKADIEAEERSPLWQQDYRQALLDLSREWPKLLPAPAQTIRTIPAPPERDVRALSGSAQRQAIMEDMTIKRTAQPWVREVYFEDTRVGQAVQIAPLLWASSRERWRPLHSLADAAVLTCLRYLEGGGDE